MRMLLCVGLGLCTVGVAGCSRGGSAAGTVADTTKAASDSSSAATPVTMATVASRTIESTVSGSGAVDVLEDERVRAPFNGVLTALTVNLGDLVSAGAEVGSMVAENSDAALRGARSMVAAARTPAEKADAAEALRVAEANIVHTPLRAAHAGVVIARPSAPGERLIQGDSVVSIAVTGQMVFFAALAQGDLAFVRPGQHARIELTARKGWVPGVVGKVMPADTASTATMRVQINLNDRAGALTVGLFGSATIVVAQHSNVPAVPKAAMLRDDVKGTTQVAVVGSNSIAHWVNVTPGISDSAWVEIVSPRLTPGQRVITSGQVGLPDSTRVVVAPPDSAQGTAPRKPR